MKRHFLTGLKALAVSALAFAAVSCYDDSELWGELEGLEQRVAALEQKLNTEVATLNSKLGAVEAAYKKADEAFNIADENVAAALKALTAELDALDGTVDGYVTSNDAALKKAIEDLMKADKENADAYKALADMDADLLAALSKLGVVSVEKKEDGSVVLTFADKSEVVVGKNTDNTNLVTIVDGEWAVVDENGVAKKLGVAVDPETELFFRVKDNVLEISYDGKKTWVSTEVEVNDETSLNIVTDVQYTEGDAYVTVVVGEAEYVLPFYQADNSELTLGRTDAFFMYGATKKIELKAEGVKEYYVMSKPDGWKASLENNVLTVTAPAKELIELGAGELEGEVLVHATADNGTCKVAKIEVSAGEALKLSYKDGIVTLFNAIVVEESDWAGSWFEFTQVFFGLIPLSDYAAYDSFDAYMASEPATLANLQTTMFNYVDDQSEYTYREGVYEEFVASMSLSDIVKNSWCGYDYDEDEVYLMWAVPQGEQSFNYDEAVYVMTGTLIELSPEESLYNNVEFDATFVGADGYAVGAVAKSKFDEWGIGEEYTYEDALKDYMMDPGYPPYMPAGPFASFVGGDKSAMGELYPSGTATINLADILLQEQSMGMYPGMPSGPSVDPDSEYFVWILPYHANKSFSDYKYEDIIISSCKTEALIKDQSVAAAVETVAGYDAIDFTITPPEGGSTKFTFLTKNGIEYSEDYREEGYVDYLLDNGDFNDAKFIESMKSNMWLLTEETTDNWTDLEQGSEYYLVTYTTKDGKYAIGIKEVKTLTVAEYVDNLEAGATWTLAGGLELTEPIVINKDLTIDLGWYGIEAPSTDAIVVTDGAKLTINGDEYGYVRAATDDQSSANAVWVKHGEVVINGGQYYVGADNDKRNDCIYVGSAAGAANAASLVSTVTINGGTFESKVLELNQYWVLNLRDEFYPAGSNIIVKGGTFKNFNPADNLSEGVGTNFVAEGYESIETAEDVYTVAMRTPAGKHWIINVDDNPDWADIEPYRGVLDFGCTAPNMFVLAVSQEDAFPDEPGAKGIWLAYTMMQISEVVPTDAVSGKVVLVQTDHMGEIMGTMDIPYSDLTATSCTFDLTDVFGFEAVCEYSDFVGETITAGIAM